MDPSIIPVILEALPIVIPAVLAIGGAAYGAYQRLKRLDIEGAFNLLLGATSRTEAQLERLAQQPGVVGERAKALLEDLRRNQDIVESDEFRRSVEAVQTIVDQTKRYYTDDETRLVRAADAAQAATQIREDRKAALAKAARAQRAAQKGPGVPIVPLLVLCTGVSLLAGCACDRLTAETVVPAAQAGGTESLVVGWPDGITSPAPADYITVRDDEGRIYTVAPIVFTTETRYR